MNQAPNKAWAHKLIERYLRGEKIEGYPLKIACEAIGKDYQQLLSERPRCIGCERFDLHRLRLLYAFSMQFCATAYFGTHRLPQV